MQPTVTARSHRLRKKARALSGLGAAGLLASSLFPISIHPTPESPIRGGVELTASPAGASPGTVPAVTLGAPGTPGLSLGSPYEHVLMDDPPAARAAALAQMAAAGTRWLRMDVFLDGVSVHRGHLSWYFDQTFEAVRRAGMQIDAMIYAPPAWAQHKNGQPIARDYARLFDQTALHLESMGVNTFEIWNEPNLVQSWGKAFTPRAYATLVKATYVAVKRDDPSSTILLGGLGTAAPTSNQTAYMPLAFLQGLFKNGIAPYFDAAADHPYTYPNFPLRAHDSWNPFQYLQLLHALMAQYGDGQKRIWLTEFGAPTGHNSRAVSRQGQATMVRQAFEWSEGRAWIGPLFIFTWQDTPADGDFGLHTRSGRPKPSAVAYSRMARGFDRRQLVGAHRTVVEIVGQEGQTVNEGDTFIVPR